MEGRKGRKELGRPNTGGGVPEAPVEAEEREGPVELWAGAGEGAGRMGGWEVHTRGVGSRLMLAMGWQVGQGLGREGQGRVEPVPAWFYPPGRGLGWRRSGGAGASCSSAPPPGGAGGGWRGRVEEEEEEQQEQERKEEVRREPL